MNRRAKLFLAILAPVIFFGFDRLLKWYALETLSLGTSVVLFPGLEYGFFLNPGLMFSSFSRSIAITASVLAFCALVFIAIRARIKLNAPLTISAFLPLLLIALGGASNIFDRIFFGGVIDYIIFARSAWNTADIMILAGLVLILMNSSKGAKVETHTQN